MTPLFGLSASNQQEAVMERESPLPEMVSDLVLAALEQALQDEGEVRLTGKGRLKGLLPSGRITPAKKEALAQCLDKELNVFRVREVAEGKGSSAATYFVTPT